VPEARKSEIGPQWRIAYAEKVREAMGEGMRAAFDSLRAVCGPCKLVWLKTDALTLGTEPEQGVVTQWHGERKRA
jgi:hypothetical protein